MVLRHVEWQIVSWDSPLPGASTCRCEALDQLRHIEAHLKRLINILYGCILIKTDKTFLAFYRGHHEPGAPFRSRKLVENFTSLLKFPFNVSTAISCGQKTGMSAGCVNSQGVVQS